MKTNRQVVLASFVTDAAKPENFALSEGPIPEPGEGEFLLRNMYFSMEPAIRGWVDGKANYFEPIPIGGVIRGPSVGVVIKSRNPDFVEGEYVYALNQWEDYSICHSDAILLEKLKPEPGIPLSYYVGSLGGAGATAYIGLREVGLIQPGQTVVVSAAAGATGSMAGQIARIVGCKVIGIVGSDEKAELIVEKFGFDAAINYKTENVTEAVMALAPEGVDIYFDNVGGPVLNAILKTMNTYGRIIACGMISDYNRTGNPNPITNLWEMVSRQLTMKGFLLPTYQDEVPMAMEELEGWIRAGDITVLENITDGFANTPRAFCELMSGKTVGKALVKVDLQGE
jgi:NADPH-dependent curcumin reductase CurA|tara:strand:- start:1708 stop:2730 length:1023 start_codon:yes stop_codon:yes gene_type:complete